MTKSQGNVCVEVCIHIALFLVVAVASCSGNSLENELCQRCAIEEDGVLLCKGLKEFDETFDMQCVPAHQRNEFHTVRVVNSTILMFNISKITSTLENVSNITTFDSNISTIVGEIPCAISVLQLRNSLIRNFTAVVQEMDAKIPCKNKSLILDFSNNLLDEIPVSVVASPRLKSLQLTDNPLKCEFIWEDVWDHLECQHRGYACKNLFADKNSTKCQFDKNNLGSSQIFHCTLTQIFDSKIRLEGECFEMNKTCACHPYNLLHGGNGKLIAYLTVNCFGEKFTELPVVPEHTWELNVSHNNINDLSLLNSSMYRNLRILDLSDNLITDLANLTYTGFMKDFEGKKLYLNSNKFRKIPDAFLARLKDADGRGKLKIGSELECDCHTETYTKGRVIEVQNSIADLNDILCGNIAYEGEANEDISSSGAKHALRLKYLEFHQVCPALENSTMQTFDWVSLIIGFEVIAILMVVIKVFYDWREYQRTGILPWIAAKLPRLPCDGILE